MNNKLTFVVVVQDKDDRNYQKVLAAYDTYERAYEGVQRYGNKFDKSISELVIQGIPNFGS